MCIFCFFFSNNVRSYNPILRSMIPPTSYHPTQDPDFDNLDRNQFFL